MRLSFILHKLIFKNHQYRSKVLGINLISVIIGASLGLFVLTVIINILITVNNQLRLIRATSDLDQASGILNHLFGKMLDANGYGVSSNNYHNFYINNNNNIASFSLWYQGSLDGASTGAINETISCSGRKLNYSSTAPEEIRIFLKSADLNTNDGIVNDQGYLTCFNRNNGLSMTDLSNPGSKMPLIRKEQIIKFYMATIVKVAGGNYRIIPIIYNNAELIGNANSYNSFGLKLAFVLRSSTPVFNVDRTVNFNNILGYTGFTFNSNDKYLYKLVVIEMPFRYAANIQTKIIKD